MRDTVRAGMACRRLLSLAAIALLTGCAAASKVADIVDVPLQAVGLSRPSEPPIPPIPPPRIRSIPLAIDASDDVNADDAGRGLALIVRVYKLRSTTAFLQTPFDRFLDPASEQAALGSELIDVHEVVLTPGQQFDTHEMLDNASPVLGVVALFRKPAAYRWRFTFKAADAEKSGIRLGAHACALTITAGYSGNDGGGRPIQQLPPSCL